MSCFITIYQKDLISSLLSSLPCIHTSRTIKMYKIKTSKLSTFNFRQRTAQQLSMGRVCVTPRTLQSIPVFALRGAATHCLWIRCIVGRPAPPLHAEHPSLACIQTRPRSPPLCTLEPLPRQDFDYTNMFRFLIPSLHKERRNTALVEDLKNTPLSTRAPVTLVFGN